MEDVGGGERRECRRRYIVYDCVTNKRSMQRSIRTRTSIRNMHPWLERSGLFGACRCAVDPVRPHGRFVIRMLIRMLMNAQPFWLRRRGHEGPVQERRKRLGL